MHRHAIFFLLGASLGACSAASSPPPPPSQPSADDEPPASTLVAVAAVVERAPPLPFRLMQADEEPWFRGLEECAQRRAWGAGLAQHDAWTHADKHSAWDERWCDLQTDETRCPSEPGKDAGTRWFALSAQVQPVTHEAYYMTFRAQIHPQHGWGARILWVRELSPITDHRNDPLVFRIELRRWVKGKIEPEAEQVISSQAVSFLSSDIAAVHTPPEGTPARLRRLLASAESLRDASLAQTEGQRAGAVASLRSGTITKCLNEGAAPRMTKHRSDYDECQPRRLLTKKEREAGIAEANAAAAAEVELIRTSYLEQWAAIEALLPEAKCRELLLR